MRAMMDITTRLYRHSHKEGECVVWNGAKYNGGYGLITVAKKCVLTHRLAWGLANGPIPKGLHVLHSCDNPPCIRVDHLFLGTNDDNIRDKLNKKRQPKGENHCRAKLTEKQVFNLRKEYAHGGLSQEAIGNKYGMSQSGISLIINSKRWRED